jgi:hypothetical protein
MSIRDQRPPWLQWTPEERLDHVAGQLEALQGFFAALVATHPDVTSLAAVFTDAGNRQEARAIGGEMSEKYVEGQDLMRRHIQAYLDEKRDMELAKLR